MSGLRPTLHDEPVKDGAPEVGVAGLDGEKAKAKYGGPPLRSRR
jgi:hypothetical protein